MNNGDETPRREVPNYMLVVFTAIDKLKQRRLLRDINREFMIYVPFVILFCLYVTYINNAKTLEMASVEEVIQSELLRRDFVGGDGKTLIRFDDINKMEDIFAFIGGPVADVFYRQTWYNGDVLEDNQRGFLGGANRILGGVTLRQQRVVKSCSSSLGGSRDYFTTADCEPLFSETTADSAAFTTKGGETWTYESGDSLLFDRTGRIGDYPGGGYFEYLPFNPKDEGGATFKARVATLKSQRWLDERTAVLFVSFPTFNFNDDIFCFSEFMFEISPHGVVWPSFLIRAFQSTTLGQTYPTWTAAFIASFNQADGWGFVQVLYFTFLFIYIGYNIKNIRTYGLSQWTLYDFTNILTLLAQVYYKYQSMVMESNMAGSIAVDSPKHIPGFNELSLAKSLELAAGGLTALLLVVRIFRFMVVSRSLMPLALTMAKAFDELVMFVFVFAVFLFTFALGGNLLFGRSVDGFRSYKVAGFTLLRMCVGDFDYLALKEALYTNMRYVAPIYFGLFVLLFIFILMNLFTVVIIGSYQNVQIEKREEDKQIQLQQGSKPQGLQYAVYLIRRFRRWYAKMKYNWKNGKSADKGEAKLMTRLTNPKVLAQGYISEEQLKKFVADDLPEECVEELMVVHRQKLPTDAELRKTLNLPEGTHVMRQQDRARDFAELTPPEMLKNLHVPTYELLKHQEKSFGTLERQIQRLYRGSRSNLQLMLQTEKKIDKLKSTLWR